MGVCCSVVLGGSGGSIQMRSMFLLQSSEPLVSAQTHTHKRTDVCECGSAVTNTAAAVAHVCFTISAAIPTITSMQEFVTFTHLGCFTPSTLSLGNTFVKKNFFFTNPPLSQLQQTACLSKAFKSFPHVFI